MARRARRGFAKTGLQAPLIMTRLIIVRHGQSESNYARFYAAATNVNLTELGRAQAEETARYLKNIHIDIAYSSNLVRVVQTAKPIVKGRNIEFIITDTLREINGGGFDGITYDEILEKYPYERGMWYTDIVNCYCPNGESLYDVYNRISPAFDDIIEKNRGKTVLIATHACPIRVMTNKFLGKPFSELNSTPWASNASVTVVDVDDDNNYNVLQQSYDQHLVDAGLTITANT